MNTGTVIEAPKRFFVLIDLHGIELSKEYYANNDLPVIEAYTIEQNGKLHKITDPDELAKMTDKRPFEEQRDSFILVKIGAKVVSHARHIVFQMAEVAVLRELFAAILARIRRLRLLVEQSG